MRGFINLLYLPEVWNSVLAKAQDSGIGTGTQVQARIIKCLFASARVQLETAADRGQ